MQTEETPIIKSEEQVEVVQPVAESTSKDYSEYSREQLIEALEQLLADSSVSNAKEFDAIKAAFDKVSEKAEDIAEDIIEKFNTLKSKAVKKLNKIKADVEKEKEANLAKKEELLVALEKLNESSDDLSKVLPEYRNIRNAWNAVGQIPAAKAKEINKQYNSIQEKFYELTKLENEFRELDFKKNLEAKTILCEEAEKLIEESDVNVAIKKIQELHNNWKQIGPVSKVLRDEIWERFKNATSQINEKNKEAIEKLKEGEKELIAAQEAICEAVKNIDYSSLVAKSHWDKTSDFVIEKQKEWKEISRQIKYSSQNLFKNFRDECDKFFAERTNFNKSLKKEMSNNLNRKIELCIEAENLANSTDWKATTEKIVALQNEWKKVGRVSQKLSDEVWERFSKACNSFFDKKYELSEEYQNLQKKKDVIAKIEAYEITEDIEGNINDIKDLMKEYTTIGHVPYKDKDVIYKAFKKASDAKLDVLYSGKRAERAASQPKSNERNKLYKKYESLKNEILTYENNLGFFTNSSKPSKLALQMNQKLDDMKAELAKLGEEINNLEE